MTPQQIDLLTFALCLIGVVFLWGFLVLLPYMPPLWKYSVITAMAFVGAGSIALFIPQMNVYADPVRAFGWTGMVVGAFYSSYLTIQKAAQDGAISEIDVPLLRRSSLRVIGAGLIAVLVSVALFFTLQQNRQTETAQVLSLQEINARLDSVEHRQRILIANTSRLLKISTADSLNTLRVLSDLERAAKDKADAARPAPAPVAPIAPPAKKRFRIWPFSARSNRNESTHLNAN